MTLRGRPRARRALAGVFAVAAAALPPAAMAQSTTPTLSIPSTHLRIGYESVRFPGAGSSDSGSRVGLLGTTYLIDLGEATGLSVGPAVYGAVRGDRGGFFTIGGELAWRRRLVGPVGVEVGVYAGGGGGGGAPPGGGFMVRPHVDLIWDLGDLALGVSYSKVRFNGGRVDSNQVGLVVNVGSDFRFVPAERLGEPALGRGRAGLGFDRVQFAVGSYFAPKGLALKDGSDLPRSIATFGVRAERSVGRHAFWGVEATRAARGDVGGYAEFLGTAGIETELIRDRLTVGARLGAGAAGGGGVSTGGGLLAKASVYSILRVGPEVGIAIEGGYATAPEGNFRAAQTLASVVWAIDGPGVGGAPLRPARTDFSIGAVRFDAPRRSAAAGDGDAIDAVSLKLDRYLNPNWYVTGNIAAATRGGASGYTQGFFGTGWLQPIGERVHVGAEWLAGAGGGGGVASSGVLILPRAYLGVQVTPAIAVRGGVGRIKSLGGRIDSTVYDLGLVLTYGVSAGS